VPAAWLRVNELIMQVMSKIAKITGIVLGLDIFYNILSISIGNLLT
jgi:hypothetical protein